MGPSRTLTTAAATLRRLLNRAIALVQFHHALVVVGMIHVDGNRALDQFLNLTQKRHFIVRTEAHCVTAGTRAGGAPDPVHIGIRLHGQIEIHHERDVLHIDATGGDVGRHQNIDLAAAVGLQGLLAGRLRFVAVDGVGTQAFRIQLFGQIFSTVFGARENEAQLAVGPVPALVQHLKHEVLLGLFTYEADGLLDLLRRRALRRDADLFGVMQHGLRKLGDLRRHGRREEERLPLLGQTGLDLANVADEAHVQHTVSLVEDESFDLREIDVPLLHQVEQAPRAGHQNIEPLIEHLDLGLLRNAAVDHTGAELDILAIHRKTLGHLTGELTGGSQHEVADTPAECLTWTLGDAVEQRQREGCRLARAGLRTGQEVALLQEHGDRLGLNRRRRGVALFSEGALDRCGQR